MARYYESKSLIDFVKNNTPHINGETTMQCVVRAIQNAPNADVAPKSEVESLAKEVDRLSQVVLYNDGVTQMLVEEAKEKVAREIFEEIYGDCFDQYGYIDYEALAELKKKYTGDK